MGQAVARGQGEKDISGCQFCFISGSGVLLEQSKISRLLTVPQKSMELNKFGDQTARKKQEPLAIQNGLPDIDKSGILKISKAGNIVSDLSDSWSTP